MALPLIFSDDLLLLHDSVRSTRIILYCSQSPQSCFLCLGHALDACDIEPLVGTVTAQRLQGFSAVQIPDPDRPIIPATSQQATIGTPLERPDGPLVSLALL